VAIVGVGAIGATVAAAVREAGGHEVVLCARRPLEQAVVPQRPGGAEVVIDAPGRWRTSAPRWPTPRAWR
jgi:ketopantoate reductase